MPPDPNHMTLAEWAAWMGWDSAGNAHHAKKEGRVVLAPGGRHVLAAESRARYLATADPAKAAVASRHASARAARQAPSIAGGADEEGAEDDERPDPKSAGSYDYQSAKARREHWAAEREENAARKEAGELIELTTHVAAFANAGASIRATLEGWAAVLPPQLVGRDESAISGIIADQVEQVLHHLTAQINGLAAETGEGDAA